MEQWETIIEVYPESPDLRDFGKALQTAGVVLKEDLAPFEIEWIIETLLHKPVKLLDMVSSLRGDDAWSKAIGDSFKLLAEVIDCHEEIFTPYTQDIVKLCLLPFEPQARKQALQCLTCFVRVAASAAASAAMLIPTLQGSTTCRAPLAILVGTICEFHPEVIDPDDVASIWRTFLILLDSNKNTATVTEAVLEGICGLFKHFGQSLPVAEINAFYDKMADDFITISKCSNVCIKIIEHYWKLFPERLAGDTRARFRLWLALGERRGEHARRCGGALRGAYGALAGGSLNADRIQTIINTEIVPQLKSHRSHVKYTALRILTDVQTKCGVHVVDASAYVDAFSLEYELRASSVSYDVAEAVLWCIESNQANSDKLLQSAILFYSNLPSSRRKEIVVHGILKATVELRTAIITFLISETCQDEFAIDKFLPLWKDLFDAEKGGDAIVVENSRYVFDDFMEYAVFVLESFFDEDCVTLPPKLSSLLVLSAHVLVLQPVDTYTSANAAGLLAVATKLRSICAHAAIVAAGRGAVPHVTDDALVEEFYQTLDIERCRDEALLCECCLALVQAASIVDVDNLLMALQIIFSSNEVEPRMLTIALRRFETVIMNNKDGSRQKIIRAVIHLVQMLGQRKDMTGKDARVLHRDILMFLGKHGINDPNDYCMGDNITEKLKDKLTLNIPNTFEGTTYKMNLQEILQVALTYEDPNSLQSLLAIICANLSTNKDPELQMAAVRSCIVLCRSHSRGRGSPPLALAVQGAMLMAGNAACVRAVLTYISEEKSPGVRRMLCDALEAVLIADSALLATTAGHANVMLASGRATTKRAGLDITQTVVTAMSEDNCLTQSILPEVLTLISNTNELDAEFTFELASRIFLEKIELFDFETVGDLIRKLLAIKRIQDGGPIKMAVVERIFRKRLQMSLDFVKKVYDCKRSFVQEVFSELNNVLDKETIESFYILAGMKKSFELDVDFWRNCLANQGFLEKFFCMDIQDDFCMEVVLKFMEEFAEVLLELQYQKTQETLSKVISKLTPTCIKYQHKNIKSCLSVYNKQFKRWPAMIANGFEDWCRNLKIKSITDSIEKDLFTNEHAAIVNALKIMLGAVSLTDLSVLTDVSCHVKKWSGILLKLYSTDYISRYLKANMAYLTDLLTVSVKFLSVAELKKILLEGHNLKGVSNEKIGIRFCRFFMSVFYDYLIKKPFVLLDKDMEACCILLGDIIKHVSKKKCTEEECDTVLELVDKLWPTYVSHSTFNEKHSVLLDMTFLPKKLGPESNPLQWAMGQENERTRLLGVLPGGEAYSSVYVGFASSLPARLAEAAHAQLRALLDALAQTADPRLLGIVVTLANGDDTKGWWDEAIESCMASVAAKSDLATAFAAYGGCFEGLGTGACARVLLPLLRYSTPSFCERFFAAKLTDLLAKLSKVRTASAHYQYHKCLVDYTIALSILQVAFEKIPPSSLEPPGSALYSELTTKQSWHLVREVCKYCVSLREKVASVESLSEAYRLFQCANYNCLAAALCARRPASRLYSCLLGTTVWDRLVGPRDGFRMPLRNYWNKRTKRQAVSIASERGSALVSGTTSTLRTRMFLRTLSENPLQYDLIYDQAPEESQPQELELSESEINSHECSGTLTALLRHVSAITDCEWTHAVATCVTEARVPVKQLLVQVIVNCKEELKSHASALRPALLAFISETGIVENGKTLLNQLHIDVLDTLVSWTDPAPIPSLHLNCAVAGLITTCLEYRQRTEYSILEATLARLLEVYGSVVRVDWTVIEPYVDDITEATKVLKLITKSKILIPELLPAVMSKLESNLTVSQLTQLSELFAVAVNCQSDSSMGRYRRLVQKMRTRNAESIALLYGARECCDEGDFRYITDLVPKIVGRERSKCLKIISSYLSKSTRTEYISDMFETIEICELISSDPVDALDVVKEGLCLMDEALKRRVVNIVAGYCGHSLVKVRKAAVEVMLKAFQALHVTNSEPLAKKPRTTSTPIIKAVESKDVYTCAVLTALSCAVIDKDGDIARMVREGVGKYLCKNDMSVRMTECYLLTVYLPILSNNKTVSLSACGSAFVELALQELRSDERFKQAKLRDEPIGIRQPSGPSKLLTMSRSYQGTMKGYSTLTGMRQFVPGTAAPDIDVQITIDSILETLLRFAQATPSAALALSAQLPLRGASGLAAGSLRPSPLAPLALKLAARFLDDDLRGVKSALDELTSITANTEAEEAVKLLREEVLLRSSCEQLVLGALDHEDLEMDVQMEDLEFSIEDLTAAFGQLANWDSLTSQQKARVCNSGLPPLWTTRQDFEAALNGYTGAEGWFSRMLSAYKNEGKMDAMKWLREADQWPRRHFYVSAVTEAIEWQSKTEQLTLPADIQPSDCLAEWAARLMIRTAFLHSAACEETDYMMLSRSHELAWCERANETGLSQFVLDCVKRNSADLYESETLPWLQQKVMAQRAIGLQRGDQEMLAKALGTAETFTPQLMENSSPDDVIAMNSLILLLSRDLHSLSKEKLQNVLEEIDKQSNRKGNRVSQTNKRTMGTVYELAITYYDDLWEESSDLQHQESIISDMSEVLARVVNLNLSRADAFLAVILCRLDDVTGLLREDVARNLLDKIKVLLPDLDEFSMEQLMNHKNLFPSRLLNDYPFMLERDGDALKYKLCLSSINDTEHTLLHYCESLRRALLENDSKQWNDAFDRMREKMFENLYAGSDYQLLNKYKDKLYEIREFESTENFKKNSEKTLIEICRALEQKRPRNVLRLSQLCPALSRLDERDSCLARLLKLRTGVTVVKFDEQVQVITDSIRRPCIVSALLSDGRSHRYLIKGGEPLRADAAAQRVLGAAGRVWGERGETGAIGYHVTPLSEDSGLIEFLEDFERVRTLISTSCDLDSVLATSNSSSDQELVLSPAAAVHRHLQLCEKVPRHSLRKALQLTPGKRERFQQSLAAMTVLTWLLGVGDRHLQNVLCDPRGCVCAVDWAAILQFGEGEPPAARLTGNMVAVCDVTVLESSIQKLLGALREAHRLMLPIIRLSFKWMGPEFEEKYQYIKSILQGRATSYDITREVINKSSTKYNDNYIQLLDDVFGDLHKKEIYKVEEQVTVLLRHCTDPRILSVTRSPWEPWV